MKKFTEITDKFCQYVSYLSMASMVFIMFYMFIDLCMRVFRNAPITGGYEITVMALSVLIFSSWSYTQTVHGHIHVTMFIGMMPTKVRFFLFGLTSVLSTGTLAVATYATFIRIFELKAQGTATGMLLIPHWPFMTIECIGLFFFTIILARDAIKAVGAMFNEGFAKEVMSTWE